MKAEQYVQKFRIDMLRRMPFYGGVVMRLRFICSTEVRTAATNGYEVLYNPSFIAGLQEPERYYVLLHEVFHVMLGHCRRSRERDPRLWNAACDMVVNAMIDEVSHAFSEAGVVLRRPPKGIYDKVKRSETVENVYAWLQQMEKNSPGSGKNPAFIAKDDLPAKPPEDSGEIDRIERAQHIFREVLAKIAADEEGQREPAAAADRNAGGGARRSAFGHLGVPSAMLQLTQSRRLDWRRLLRDMMEMCISEETSYLTPERKYIHMDLLVPGYGMQEETLNNVWMFIDSSGSVDRRDLEQFLTQAARISREFSCPLNIAYWDTKVADVYRNVIGEKKVLACQPHHSGGTDINCVYRWMRENRVRPDTLIILTDGEFGTLREPVSRALARRTVVVLTENGAQIRSLPSIGKYARL